MAVVPPPPRVAGLPLVGSAFALFRDPIAFLLEAHRRHGPIFALRALHLRYVVMAGPEANAFVHETGQHLFSSSNFWRPFLEEIDAPHSIVGLEGEDHAAVRRLLAPQMSKPAAERRLDDLVRITREALDACPDDAPVPFVRFAQQTISRQVGWLLTGSTPSPAEHAALLDYMGTASVALSLRRLPRWTLALAGRRFREAKRTTFALAERVITGSPDSDGPAPRYITDVLAAAARLPHLFTPGDIRAAGILPFFAGVDTVGQTLAFALHAVLRRPALLARLRAEIDAAFDAGPLTATALRGMATLHGVVLETLRLHPTAFGISRTAVDDFVFAGCQVRRGEDVLVFTTACHFLPEFFPEPARFDPDRHLPPREEHHRPDVFAPFGRGPHACLGASFSQVQLATTLATVLHHCDPALVAPDHDHPVVLMPTPSLGPTFAVRLPRRAA